MNRIVNAIEKMRIQIRDRIANGITTADKVAETHKALDMDLGEFVRFQELKSLAVASGVLTTEEGMTIFRLLGGTPETFNKQDTATKAVLTSAFREMLERSMTRG